jgi:hypothetical protein
MLRIADPGVPVTVGEPRSLDLEMQSLRADRVQFFQIVSGQDVQHHEGDDALAIGRTFEDIVATVVRSDRIDIFAPIFGEVLEAVNAAPASQVANEVPCDRPLIESIPPLLGDKTKAAGELGLSMQAPARRDLAARKEDAGRGRILRQMRLRWVSKKCAESVTG